MSDYLTNLAARSLAAPTLRPRTRSRFEPEANASPWATLPSSEVALTDPAMPAPRASRRASASPDAESIDERPPFQSAPHTRRVADDETGPRTRRNTIAEVQAHVMTPPASNESRIERIETRHETKSASHVLQTTERVTERVIERIHEQHETTIRNEVPRDAHTVDATTEIDRPRHRYDEQPPRITRETQQPSTTLVTREVRSPSRAMPAETSHASEPMIHVSIGRVEVRAVAPAPTPQRSRTRTAPMTVEDYAARRNAKGRP